jgi:hypothetical protein
LITCTDPSTPPPCPIGVPLPPFINYCYRRCYYCRRYWCCYYWKKRGYSSWTICGKPKPSCPGISLSQLNLRIYDFD